MKKRKFLVSVLAVFALVFGLAACGSDPAAEAKKNFVGTWELDGMTSDGEETGSDELELLKAFGMNVYLTIDEDGKGSMEMFGSGIDFSWTAKDASTITLQLDVDEAEEAGMEETTQDVTFADDKISMEAEGDTMTFKKIDPSEKIEADASDLSSLFEVDDSDTEDTEIEDESTEDAQTEETQTE